jgi:hypothetical protein
MAVRLSELEKHPSVRAYVQQADANLAAMGFTEHGFRHISLVSSIARNILLRLGYDERQAELAAIAGQELSNQLRLGQPQLRQGAVSLPLIAPLLVPKRFSMPDEYNRRDHRLTPLPTFVTR